MFVEIRHVETGSMSQVIQGNNLRCLFTDVPVSVGQAHVRMYSEPTSHRRAMEQGVILASDDRVLTLHMAVPPGR
jgi:RHO1 GDP-GTP exchange protein 1/2